MPCYSELQLSDPTVIQVKRPQVSPEATELTMMCRDRRRTTRPEEMSIRTGPTVPTTSSVILISICCSGVAKNNPKYSKMTFLGLRLFADVIKCVITKHDNYVGKGSSRYQEVRLHYGHVCCIRPPAPGDRDSCWQPRRYS